MRQSCQHGQYRRMTPARLFLLALLAAAIAAAFAFGVPRQLSWAALALHQAVLQADARAHPWLAALAYIGVYAAVVALSVPGGGVLTVAGGLMFGPWRGAALAVVGASLGAILLFLLARTLLAAPLQRRLGRFAERLREGLARDGFNYLLALRLVPVVPFWLVNLAPALLGMKLLPYAAATVLGIIPATVVFAGIGAGLSDVLASGHTPNPAILLTPRLLLPLLGLALLALLPALWRHRRAFLAGG